VALSQRKLDANARNAQRSTGPRTRAGKARSSKNAFSHGLAIPIWGDPELQQEARELVEALANEHGRDTGVLETVRTIAEAEIELARVRAVRAGLLKTALRLPQNTIDQELFRTLRLLDRYERRALSKRKFAIRTLTKLPVAGSSEPLADGDEVVSVSASIAIGRTSSKKSRLEGG
jgi:hypothetical protein